MAPRRGLVLAALQVLRTRAAHDPSPLAGSLRRTSRREATGFQIPRIVSTQKSRRFSATAFSKKWYLHPSLSELRRTIAVGDWNLLIKILKTLNFNLLTNSERAKSTNRPTRLGMNDPELARLVTVWAKLPNRVKQSISVLTSGWNK